jgi:hypothetical protein
VRHGVEWSGVEWSGVARNRTPLRYVRDYEPDVTLSNHRSVRVCSPLRLSKGAALAKQAGVCTFAPVGVRFRSAADQRLLSAGKRKERNHCAPFRLFRSSADQRTSGDRAAAARLAGTSPAEPSSRSSAALHRSEDQLRPDCQAHRGGSERTNGGNQGRRFEAGETCS